MWRVDANRALVKKLANRYNWQFLTYQANIGMISYIKSIKGSECRINVYLSKMTVSTSLEHPKLGKTQLYRNNVDNLLLHKIFDNPRVHTCKGYRRKRGKVTE